MGTRPTVADVAGKAGVSVATVDRVLNGRHKVREETARKVYEAANAIGYHGAPLIRQRMTADLPQMNFGFVLQRADQHFYRSFGEMLVKAVENARGRICALSRARPPMKWWRRLPRLGRESMRWR
jgi:LacI family transcriptional regulator